MTLLLVLLVLLMLHVSSLTHVVRASSVETRTACVRAALWEIPSFCLLPTRHSLHSTAQQAMFRNPFLEIFLTDFRGPTLPGRVLASTHRSGTVRRNLNVRCATLRLMRKCPAHARPARYGRKPACGCTTCWGATCSLKTVLHAHRATSKTGAAPILPTLTIGAERLENAPTGFQASRHPHKWAAAHLVASAPCGAASCASPPSSAAACPSRRARAARTPCRRSCHCGRQPTRRPSAGHASASKRGDVRRC